MTAAEPTAELDPRFQQPEGDRPALAGCCRGVERAEMFWLSTVRGDGRPHVTPLPAIWLDGRLHFCTGPGEQKAKNLERDPRCVLTTGNDRFLTGLDVVHEGSAARVADESLLRRLAELWLSKLCWSFEVVDGAFQDRSSEVDGAAFDSQGSPTCSQWRRRRSSPSAKASRSARRATAPSR